MRREGKIIVLEGMDESGKTTQAKLLADGLCCDYAKEPHDTESEVFNIRGLLTSSDGLRPCPRAEALLFAASRAQLVEEIIKPNIVAGEHTVLDRFTDSSMAYQGLGLGLGAEPIRRLCDYSADWVSPDVVIYLHIGWEELVRRREASSKPKSRFDSTTRDFYDKAVSWFENQCYINPQIYVKVDGSMSVDSVYKCIRGHLRDRLGF